MNKKYKLIAALLALIILALPMFGLADAGNFSGDSDYGGDSGGWDSSSDWGSDDDWSSDSSSGGIYIGDFGGSMSTWITIGIIIYILYKLSANRSKSSSQQQRKPRNTNLDQLKQGDPDFSEEAFLEQVGNTYVQIQQAWEAKKWEPMRAVMTDAMYNQFNRQLQDYIDNEQTNHVDRIAVLGTSIVDYSRDDVNDILTVELRTRIVDYVTSDETGEVIRGSNTKELFMTYEYTFIRKQGVVTERKDDASALNCPNCGAPLDINHSGKCPYCGSIVSSGEYDWVISNIKGISQRSS